MDNDCWALYPHQWRDGGATIIRLSPVDSPHLIWPVLEESLKAVIEKTGERWTPPFVLRKLEEGTAGLFRFTDDGEHVAWMVVEKIEQGMKPWMNVWILHGEGLEKAPDIVPWIDLLARQIGADRWRFTGRKGWKVLGLTPKATVFERVLT